MEQPRLRDGVAGPVKAFHGVLNLGVRVAEVLCDLGDRMQPGALKTPLTA